MTSVVALFQAVLSSTWRLTQVVRTETSRRSDARTTRAQTTMRRLRLSRVAAGFAAGGPSRLVAAGVSEGTPTRAASCRCRRPASSHPGEYRTPLHRARLRRAPDGFHATVRRADTSLDLS